MKVCMKKEKFLKKCLDWGFRVFVSFSSPSPLVSLPFPFVVWLARPHEHSGQLSAEALLHPSDSMDSSKVKSSISRAG